MPKATQRRKKNLFGFGRSKDKSKPSRTTTYDVAGVKAAYTAGYKSGSTMEFKSWLRSRGFDKAAGSFQRKLEERYRAGVDAGIDHRIKSREEARQKKEDQLRKKEEAQQRREEREEAKASKGTKYRYLGETITKRAGEYWLSDGSAAESLADAKELVRSLRRNPKRKAHYQDAVVSSALGGSLIPLGAEILRNPAASAAQYRLAQAVLSGTARETGMPKSVAREIVERTPERMRKVYMKRNPEDAAEELYEKFHGAPSEESIVVEEEHHYHSNLTALGVLIELKVKTVPGPRATLRFSHKNEEDTVYLASNEAGTQLFFENGDQQIDLEAMGFDSKMANRDSVVIGSLRTVVYRTRKKFDRMESVDYVHQMGEESKQFPVLLYDTINQKLSVSGGAYEILAPGITD